MPIRKPRAVRASHFTHLVKTRSVSLAFAAALFVLSSAPSNAETRVALIVGNGAYQQSEMRLPNPANDAAAMARALKAAIRLH